MRQTQSPSFETITRAGDQLLSIEQITTYLKEHNRTCTHAHIHPHTEILWIIKGSGQLHLDMQVFNLGTGNMFFIRPGQVHKLHCDENTTGFIFSISKTLLENAATEIESASSNAFVASLLDQKQISIGQNYLADIKDIVERMIKETNDMREYSAEILSRYFNIFLFYLKKQLPEIISKSIQSRNTQVSQQFKDLVDKHYKTKKGVSDYASELNLTPNYLNEIIKKQTGNSAGHFIRQRIALEAKRYALHSRVCMKEIGYHLGFSDMAHFSKFFKSVVGSNFTEFKNSKMGFAVTQ
jgi:AraC family transcriptional regulator, transcriptional activator of pobA